jgi:phosphate transport system protein
MARTQYVVELESVRDNLLHMGETAVSLFGVALGAIAEANPGSLAKASELESQTDHQHRLIHDQCLNLITLQAPVARDAVFVTGVLDAIVDLELIGDYAYEIAALSAAMRRRPPSQIVAQFTDLGARTQDTLRAAIDCWRTGERAHADFVRARQSAIKAECETLYDKLSQLTSVSGDTASYVDLMLVCRHVERILRHAVAVAEQAMESAASDAPQ